MSVMTFKNGVLASDTLCNDSGVVCGLIHKCGKTADGWLWGVVGHTALLAGFKKWAEHRNGEPERFDKEHTDFVLISPEGVMKSWLGEGWIELLPQDFHAWGSGRDFAMAAMYMGADAYLAVEIACKFEVHCGGPVIGFALSPDVTLPATDEAKADEVEPFDYASLFPTDEEASVLNDPTVVKWREKLGLA